MGIDDIRRMPGHGIRRAQQIMTALFGEEIGSDLTSVQYAALVVIGEQPGIDATALSGRIAFDRATIGGVIERLETKKLIRRTGSTTDKRVKRLHLTAAGVETIMRLSPAVTRAQERLLSAFDPEEQAAFLRLLDKLVETHGPSLPVSDRTENPDHSVRDG